MSLLDRILGRTTHTVTDRREDANAGTTTSQPLGQPNAPTEPLSGTTHRIGAPGSRSLTNNADAIAHFAKENGAHGEELPGFDNWLMSDHGIPKKDDAGTRDIMVERFSAELNAVEAALDAGVPKDEKKALKRYATTYKVALRILKHADAQNPVETATAVRDAKGVFYTTLAKQVRDVGGRRNIGGLIGVGVRFVAQRVYELEWEDPTAKVGRGKGAKEANNLVDPNDSTRFVTARQMDGMTRAQVADLDIPANHPMWKTEAQRAENPDGFASQEAWLERMATADLKKAGIDVPYSLKQASKVVFFSKLRDAATSPKIGVVDAFGNDMGLKWGEETATEPVVNRLFTRLGLKFTDLVDNHVGEDAPKLILPADAADGPTTVDAFVSTMKASAYDFNAKPHIKDSCVITEANVDAIMKDLHDGAPVTRDALIGRTMIRFKESMTEAKHSANGRAGPVPLHRDADKNDRVHRGMQLAYMWFHLSDNKEDNHRYAFPKGFDGAKGRSAVAFVHDTGSGLGGASRSGMLNDLHVDGKFLRKEFGLLGNNLVSSEFQLYRAGAWEQETVSDLLWMAKKIVSISQAEIRECAEFSQWPDFMKDVLVWRLAKRRDIIAEEFGLKVADPAGEPPTVKVPLTTRSDREAAAKRFDLPLDQLESRLRDAKKLDQPFTDTLVDDGELKEADDTILIGLLRDTHYPTGLVNRTNRREDGGDYDSGDHRYDGDGIFN